MHPPLHIPALGTVLAGLVLLAAPSLRAAGAHDHDHDHAVRQAGPHGGRLVHALEPHFEFLVLPDRRLQVTFVDDDLRPLAPTTQEISAVTGDRSSPTRLAFVREGDVLVSDAPLPPGDNLPIILTLRASPDSPVVRERFAVNLATCPGCTLAEYACTCAH